MLRVSFSPAPECVVADCWNRAFPTPPCHQGTVIIIIVLYLNKLLGRERVFWKAIYTTLKYFGLAGWLAGWPGVGGWGEAILVIWSPFLVSLAPKIWCPKKQYMTLGPKFLCRSWTCVYPTKISLFSKKKRKISGSSRRDLKLGSVKTRFKASWDDFCENVHAAFVSQVMKKKRKSTKYEL